MHLLSAGTRRGVGGGGAAVTTNPMRGAVTGDDGGDERRNLALTGRESRTVRGSNMSRVRFRHNAK